MKSILSSPLVPSGVLPLMPSGLQLRRHGTKTKGGAWSEQEKLAVWLKASPVIGYDPNRYRMDRFGAFMDYTLHGVTSHPWGWEIDHIRAVANGGGDEVGNLQPLQWKNNRSKGEK